MYSTKIQELVTVIKNNRESISIVANVFRDKHRIPQFDKWNQEHWCHSIFSDGLVKLRLLIENNFHVVETLSLVSTSRYLLELSIWLNLVNNDPSYGLVYYRKLIDNKKKYWERLKKQMEREIILLKEFEKEEKDIHTKKLNELMKLKDEKQKIEAAKSLTSSVFEVIDSKAARRFSIYAEQAKTAGYGFQAHLINSKQLPKIDAAINEIKPEIEAFDSNVIEEVKKKAATRESWADMAKKAGLSEEYDYIYFFSSSLMHALPESITTDQKNLEEQEIIIFLKYINIKIMDIHDLSYKYLQRYA